MPQRLRCMAGALSMRDKFPYLLSRCRTRNLEGDMHLIEIRRCIVNIVLFCVAEGSSHIGECIIDGHSIERREPRQLGK